MRRVLWGAVQESVLGVRYQWMDIHEGCLITICSLYMQNNTSTRTHAQERHASCVMRAQRLNAVSSSSHPSSSHSKYHPCCSSSMMIMMGCVCVTITQPTKVCTRLALSSSDVLISSSPCLLGLIAHCSLLIAHTFMPPYSTICSVVKLSMFSLFSLFLLSSCSRCSH